MHMTSATFAGLSAVILASLLLSGCSTPTLAPGFVIRTDLNTTNCSGSDVTEIDAKPSGGFDFLKVKTPGDSIPVEDCTRAGGTVPRTAGLGLQMGDVLLMSSGIVGPSYQAGGAPEKVGMPATIAGPSSVTIRQIHPTRGRLYPEEDQFLAASFSMAARHSNQVLTAKAPLSLALERRQILLWNTLMQQLRLHREPDDPVSVGARSPRPALALLVRRGEWCDRVRSELGALGAAGDPNAGADATALTTYFSGIANRCADNEAELSQQVFDIAQVTNLPRSALQAVASVPQPRGVFPARGSTLAIHTHVAVRLQGARIGSSHGSSGEAHWTLADWESSGICRSLSGEPLKIHAVQTLDGDRVYIQPGGPVTFEVRLVFTQTQMGRSFVPLVPWYSRWKREIVAADLDKLYAADVRSVTWSAEPASPAMCTL
jgi:hypothetical protein